MIDRLVRRALGLLVVVLILPTAVTVLGPILLAGVRSTVENAVRGLPAFVAMFVSSVFVGIFLLGALARLGHAVTHRDRRADRRREGDERRARRAARRRAEDVPLVGQPARPPIDPDPALDAIDEE